MTKLERAAIRQAIMDRKIAYTQVFGGEGAQPAIKAVVADLEKFCRSNESTFHVQERVHVLLEGRREVMLRIQDYLNLSLEQLLLKYDGRKELLNAD